MPRTQKRYLSDQGYTDGQIFISALSGIYTSGTVTATVDTDPGVYSMHVGNTQTVLGIFPLNDALFRYGMNDDLQEQFGSSWAAISAVGGAQGQAYPGFTTYGTSSVTAGSAVSIPVQSSSGFLVGNAVTIDTSTSQEVAVITAIADATHITATIAKNHTAPFVVSNNSFTTPAGVTGPPPFTGVTEFTSVTSPRPKGVKIKTVYPWYSVAGASLSSGTIGVYQTVAANNVAPAVTTLLAATNLVLTTQAQPRLPAFSLGTSAPWITNKFSQVNLELNLVTAGGGTAVLYGIFLDVDFNYL